MSKDEECRDCGRIAFNLHQGQWYCFRCLDTILAEEEERRNE